MLIALTIWIVFALASYGYGRLVLSYGGSPDLEPVVCRFYVGMLLMAVLLFAAAIFHKLSWWCGPLVLLPGLTLAGSDRTLLWNNRRKIFAGLALMAPIALWCASGEINFYDTALYHQQAAKWLAQYGLVKGVGLICFRFALVSSWFALAAPLNHGALAGREAAILGGMPFVLMVVPSILLCWTFAIRRSVVLRSLTWIVFCLGLVAVCLVRSVEISLSPDMMAWLAPGIVLLLLTDTRTKETDRIGQSMVIAALAFLAKVSVAPTLGWCVILGVWQLFRKRVDSRRLLGYFAISGLLIGLFLLANIIASGCPIFPSPFSCLPVEWSVGRDFAARNFADIVAYNGSGRYTNQIHALLAAAAVSSLAIAVFRFVEPLVRHALALSWLGIAFVLIEAPVPRYGMGYFLLPVAVGCALSLEVAGRWVLQSRPSRLALAPRQLRGAGAAGALAFFGLITSSSLLLHPGALSHLIVPVSMARFNGDPIHVLNQKLNFRGPLVMDQEPYGSVTIWTPSSSDQCWDAPLPCSFTVSADRLVLRDPAKGFRAGFAKALDARGER